MKLERILWIILSSILIIALGIGVYYHYKTLNLQKRSYIQTINAINDTVSQYRNEKGELVYKISAIQMDSYKDFLSIVTKDSLIIELQKRMAYYKNKAESATIFNVKGEASASSSTKVEIDTIKTDTIKFSPIYISQFFDPWLSLATKSTVDSTSFKLSFQDTYTITQLNDEEGIYVEIINQSPYVMVNNIRHFRITLPEPPKHKKWGIGVQGGYGINFLDNRVQLSPYVGIGVSYNLWGW